MEVDFSENSHQSSLSALGKQISPVWVACSGGIDSLWLFHFFKNIARIDVIPVFFDHPGVYPEERIAVQKLLAAEDGIVIEFGRKEMLAVWGGLQSARCYRCKQHLFARALTLVPDSVSICDGSHIEDDPGRRPGMQALLELGVVSPLRACGWDKEMIRAAARNAGLKAWNQPARACLVVDGKLEI